MNAIQLLYAKSIISVRGGDPVQELEFSILVENLACHKQITVHWAGDDDIWHVLPARYHCQSGQGREKWLAKTSCRPSSVGRLPGNIRFALQYLVANKDYWDNNNHFNYFLKADAGVLLGPGVLLTHIGFCHLLPQGETVRTVVVAIHRSLQAGQVFVRWTGDNWKTYHQARCFLQQVYWHNEQRSNADNPNEFGLSVWTARIKVRDAFSVEYAIGCETEQGEVWDDNFGINYFASRAGLKILTLNLHCYQEADQDGKFGEIARAIHEVDADIACLQEVGEEWNDGQGNWLSNAARIIQERLQEYGRYYHLCTDWSHIGFDRYREGCAILSRYDFLKQGAAYVSDSCEIHDIHSRKVIMAQIHFPYVGLVNVFSVHLSWWENGFSQQFEKLRQWSNDADSAHVVATLLCGDFNNKAGSQGYMLVAEDNGYEDQFLRATSPAIFAEVFRNTSPGRGSHLANDGRIDFIFAKKGSRLKPVSARILFTGQDYKMVSDHLAYLVEFEPE